MDLARIHVISNLNRDSLSSNNKKDAVNLGTSVHIHVISNLNRDSLSSNNKKDVVNLGTSVHIHVISNLNRDSLENDVVGSSRTLGHMHVISNPNRDSLKKDVVGSGRTLARINAREMKDWFRDIPTTNKVYAILKFPAITIISILASLDIIRMASGIPMIAIRSIKTQFLMTVCCHQLLLIPRRLLLIPRRLWKVPLAPCATSIFHKTKSWMLGTHHLETMSCLR